MRFISTKTHGALDYGMALVLIVVPLFYLGGLIDTALWVLIGAGIALLGVSLMTRYELGAVKAIPMPAHLALDGLLGIFLILSPWLFMFSSLIWWPHVVAGLLEIGAALMTSTRPSLEQHAATHTGAEATRLR